MRWIKWRNCSGLAPWVLVLGLAVLSGAALAQDAPPAKEEETPPIPEPEPLVLKTRDRLALAITYYGSVAGKKAVPVLLLHDHRGDRTDFHDLAMLLQQQGCAVITADLRGHGGSKKVVAPDGATSREIDAARLRKDDLYDMVRYDLQAVRKFLLEKNNDGLLNLSKLCVVGTGMSSVLAMNWAMVDWSAPPLVTGKQGQDVRALVLVSPEWDFKGVSITQPMNHPAVQKQIAVLVAVGAKNSAALRLAKRIYTSLSPFHPEPPPSKVREEKDLFLWEASTSLQGAKLLASKSLRADAAIADFIRLRLIAQDFPWEKRYIPGQ